MSEEQKIIFTLTEVIDNSGKSRLNLATEVVREIPAGRGRRVDAVARVMVDAAMIAAIEATDGLSNIDKAELNGEDVTDKLKEEDDDL